MLVQSRRELWADVSAAGLTRPALGDLNLEAAAELRLPEHAAAARALRSFCEGVGSRRPVRSICRRLGGGVLALPPARGGGLAAF